MKLKALIKRMVKDKVDFHDQEVEFIVCVKDTGEIVTMDIERNADTLAKVLKMFGPRR